MKDIQYSLKQIEIDSISKFNIFDPKKLTQLNHIIFFTKLSPNSSTFLKDLFFLTKLSFFWFDKKITILNNFKEKKKKKNKGKTSLFFFIGCTLRKDLLFKNLNYIKNILFLYAKKFDGNLKYKNLNNGYIYSFFNTNFLLGMQSERFFNNTLKLNFFFKFNTPKNKYDKFNYNKIKFYEKVLF